MRQVLLAVSFGTSVEEARALDLAGVERALRRAAPELPFDRAYTSPTVRRILARRGERVPGLEEALESQAAAGTEELYVVPTHVLPGAEYDRVAETAARFRPRFSALHLGRPLLWDTAGGPRCWTASGLRSRERRRSWWATGAAIRAVWRIPPFRGCWS